MILTISFHSFTASRVPDTAHRAKGFEATGGDDLVDAFEERFPKVQLALHGQQPRGARECDCCTSTPLQSSSHHKEYPFPLDAHTADMTGSRTNTTNGSQDGATPGNHIVKRHGFWITDHHAELPQSKAPTLEMGDPQCVERIRASSAASG